MTCIHKIEGVIKQTDWIKMRLQYGHDRSAVSMMFLSLTLNAALGHSEVSTERNDRS